MTGPWFTATRMHLLLASLMGCAGVALLAAGAHVAGGQATTAGQVLLFHAVAVLAATSARKAGLMQDLAARIAVFLMISGAVLFSADLALRAFGGIRLFPMAAPLGGSLTIASWLALALSAAIPSKN